MAARVLIIEDNQANMDLMCYLLSAFGHTPLCAYDGVQGVSMAWEERPDLVICDIHLPRLDGYGVVRQLKDNSATAGIPVLAASALPVSDGGAALRAAGFDGHLPKSLEPDTLIPSIEAFLPPALRGGVAPQLHGDSGASQQGQAGEAPRARILLIDSSPADCGLVASILVHFGYSLTVVADERELSHCAGRCYDLLLCDIDTTNTGVIPGRASFAASALSQWPALPLVLIRSSKDDSVDALLAAAQSKERRLALLLSHPLEPQQLADALDGVLADVLADAQGCTDAAMAPLPK